MAFNSMVDFPFFRLIRPASRMLEKETIAEICNSDQEITSHPKDFKSVSFVANKITDASRDSDDHEVNVRGQFNSCYVFQSCSSEFS